MTRPHAREVAVGAPAYDPQVAIEVRSAAGHWDDFASFMVPKTGRGCVCMSYRNSSLGPAERIDAMHALCDAEPGPGVLAYVDGTVAGWCSVAPREEYRRLLQSRTIPAVDDERRWSVVCFVVRPGFRKRGLLHPLLDGAVEFASRHGARLVEGYPVDSGGRRVEQTMGYVGSVELFEAHGFRRVAPTTSRSGEAVRWVVRRELTPA